MGFRASAEVRLLGHKAGPGGGETQATSEWEALQGHIEQVHAYRCRKNLWQLLQYIGSGRSNACLRVVGKVIIWVQ